MDSLSIIPTLSIYQNGSGYLSIDLKIAREVHLAFRSFPPRQHSHHNKKQAKQLEARASSP